MPSRLRMSRARPCGRLSRGFTLLELSIVLVIGVSFLIGMGLAQHARMLQLRAQVMGQRYQVLLAAAQRYVEFYRSALIALPTGCSVSSYQTGKPKSPDGAVAAGNCRLQLDNQGRSVWLANAMQPSTDELLALGLLDAGTPVALALDRQLRVFNPAFASSAATQAPERLGVLVRKLCGSTPCSGPVVLESLVYNLQPYVLEGGSWAYGRADQVRVLFNELGDGAAMSQQAEKGALIGQGFTLANPVQEDGGTLGVPGVVALRASTNTSVDALWARRDGQSRISGDWNFSSNQLGGVSTLGAQTVQARDLELSGNAALNTASAQSIAVDSLQANKLRLPSVQAGQTCDPSQANVALDSSTGRLLTCLASTLVWGQP